MSLHLDHVPFKDKLEFCSNWHTRIFDHKGRTLGISSEKMSDDIDIQGIYKKQMALTAAEEEGNLISDRIPKSLCPKLKHIFPPGT